jgi:hypothetical protein
MYPNFLDIWSGYTTDNMYVTLGNHDYYGTTYGREILDQIPATSNLIGTTKLDNKLYCYDFVRGPIHFFEFNTGAVSDNIPADPDSQLAAQLAEMLPIISASTSIWKIVFFHMPPYTNDEFHKPGVSPMRLDYDALGVDLVMGGHAHNYEFIISGNTKYMVNGLGGSNLRRTTTPYVTGTQFSYSGSTADMKYGYTIATATDTYIIFDTYDIDDVLIHSFHLGTLPMMPELYTLFGQLYQF